MTLEDAITIWLAFDGDPDLSDETQELVFEAREIIWQRGCKLRKIRRYAIIDDAGQPTQEPSPMHPIDEAKKRANEMLPGVFKAGQELKP